MKKVMRLHGMPKSIVSDWDYKFVSKFWQFLHDALGTKFSLSVVFQSKHTIQTLADMLHACVLPWNGSWEDHLTLAEFADNNSYQTSIKIVPYEVLYGWKCISPLCLEVPSE
jgi:hypothetical protein